MLSRARQTLRTYTENRGTSVNMSPGMTVRPWIASLPNELSYKTRCFWIKPGWQFGVAYSISKPALTNQGQIIKGLVSPGMNPGLLSKEGRKPMRDDSSRGVTRFEICFNKIALAAVLRKTAEAMRQSRGQQTQPVTQIQQSTKYGVISVFVKDTIFFLSCKAITQRFRMFTFTLPLF